MVIKDAKSIEDYKRIRAEHIQAWIDARFAKGSVTWELVDALTVKITDQTGDSMEVSLDEIK